MEITMKSHKYNQSLIGRRNFLIAGLLSPLLVDAIIPAFKITEVVTLPLADEDNFVILAGWVLLKDDLK